MGMIDERFGLCRNKFLARDVYDIMLGVPRSLNIVSQITV